MKTLRPHPASFITYFALCILLFASCGGQKEHTAPAVNPRDSVAMMVSYGVNTLISDSGVMRYRIVAERWEVNENLNPPRWIFRRGLFMEQFDEKFHAQTFVQSDTAYYYTIRKLWHLKGNVRVKTADGLRFSSEELYWDQNRHELYSNLYSHVISPERELQGACFVSDEHMRHYTVSDTRGNFMREDEQQQSGDAVNQSGDEATPTDSIVQPKRTPTQPSRKR